MAPVSELGLRSGTTIDRLYWGSVCWLNIQAALTLNRLQNTLGALFVAQKVGPRHPDLSRLMLGHEAVRAVCQNLAGRRAVLGMVEEDMVVDANAIGSRMRLGGIQS